MSVMINRIPPQNIQAEQSLLGSCLSYGHIVVEMEQIAKPEAFYKPAHSVIFQAMVDLAKDKQVVDIITVSERLAASGKLDEVGGPTYLCQLTDGIPSKANAGAYAGIVRHKYELRNVISGATEIIDNCYNTLYDGQEGEMVQALEHLFKKVTVPGSVKKKYRHISEIMPEVVAKIEAAANGGAIGVPTGFNDLDKMLSGLCAADLVVIAARPGQGKTSIAMNMAEHQALKLAIPIGVISLEMNGPALGTRLVCSVSGIDSHLARTGKVNEADWSKITKAVGTINSAPIFIDDFPAQKASMIRRKAVEMKEKHGIEVLYVDYLQLAKGDTAGQNREGDVREISGELKAIAKELNIPVVALSQLSRECEKRPDKRPQLSDLRDSGAIEQDADVILFIYRDDYYNKSPNSPNKGIAEVIIAKQRNGPTGIIKLAWIEQTTTFRNLITMHERV